ncbi:hypothetical protein BJ912DRAFT_1059791 [Pholiota molesta]|nr:hypothetical protein BJ912DRAFT_1059791 [Pholiota molesta]
MEAAERPFNGAELTPASGELTTLLWHLFFQLTQPYSACTSPHANYALRVDDNDGPQVRRSSLSRVASSSARFCRRGELTAFGPWLSHLLATTAPSRLLTPWPKPPPGHALALGTNNSAGAAQGAAAHCATRLSNASDHEHSPASTSSQRQRTALSRDKSTKGFWRRTAALACQADPWLDEDSGSTKTPQFRQQAVSAAIDKPSTSPNAPQCRRGRALNIGDINANIAARIDGTRSVRRQRATSCSCRSCAACADGLFAAQMRAPLAAHNASQERRTSTAPTLLLTARPVSPRNPPSSHDRSISAPDPWILTLPSATTSSRRPAKRHARQRRVARQESDRGPPSAPEVERPARSCQLRVSPLIPQPLTLDGDDGQSRRTASAKEQPSVSTHHPASALLSGLRNALNGRQRRGTAANVVQCPASSTGSMGGRLRLLNADEQPLEQPSCSACRMRPLLPLPSAHNVPQCLSVFKRTHGSTKTHERPQLAIAALLFIKIRRGLVPMVGLKVFRLRLFSARCVKEHDKTARRTSGAQESSTHGYEAEHQPPRRNTTSAAGSAQSQRTGEGFASFPASVSFKVLGSQPCLKRDKKPSKIIDAQRTASLILVASTGAIAFQASRVTTATEERTRSAPKVASTSFKYAFSAIFPFNARPDLFHSAPGSLEASSIVHTLSSSSNPRLGAMDLSSLGRQFSHIRHILALLSSLSYVKHPLL